jgi:apolipoprotein D and lipocalin family protein
MSTKVSIGPFQPNLNLRIYLGLWYEIAKLPQPFEKGCSRATANYTLQIDGNIGVHNVCYDENWEILREIDGQAITDSKEPALITVSFPNIPTFGPNYIIHETNYLNYALVGSPDRSNLYILSRYEQIKPCCLKKFLNQFAGWGYNVDRVVINYDAIAPMPAN